MREFSLSSPFPSFLSIFFFVGFFVHARLFLPFLRPYFLSVATQRWTVLVRRRWSTTDGRTFWGSPAAFGSISPFPSLALSSDSRTAITGCGSWRWMEVIGQWWRLSSFLVTFPSSEYCRFVKSKLLSSRFGRSRRFFSASLVMTFFSCFLVLGWCFSPFLGFLPCLFYF